MVEAAEVFGFPQCGVALFVSDEAYTQFAEVAAELQADPDALAESAILAFVSLHQVHKTIVRRAA